MVRLSYSSLIKDTHYQLSCHNVNRRPLLPHCECCQTGKPATHITIMSRCFTSPGSTAMAGLSLAIPEQG